MSGRAIAPASRWKWRAGGELAGELAGGAGKLHCFNLPARSDCGRARLVASLFHAAGLHLVLPARSKSNKTQPDARRLSGEPDCLNLLRPLGAR